MQLAGGATSVVAPTVGAGVAGEFTSVVVTGTIGMVGRIAGGELGASIGTIGGPLGVAAGFVVGTVVGYLLTKYAEGAVEGNLDAVFPLGHTNTTARTLDYSPANQTVTHEYAQIVGEEWQNGERVDIIQIDRRTQRADGSWEQRETIRMPVVHGTAQETIDQINSANRTPPPFDFSHPGQTQIVQTASGPVITPVTQTVSTPSGEQRVWVGSSYLGGGTSGDNSAQTGTTTTGQTTSGHQSGPGNGYLVGNANSNSSNHDDDNDNSNTNIWNNGHDNDPDMNEAAGGGAGGASGGVTTTTTTGTTYVNTGNNPGNNNAAGYNPPVVTTTTTTTTTTIYGPQPILLDLDGNGIQISGLTRSTVFMEGQEGLKHRTAWAGAGDGVLFYDTDGDNAISDVREYVFTEWDPTAKDDLAALRSRFDANGDGRLTGTELTGFKVMRTNPDGSLTAVTLASLNITQINLKQDATRLVSTHEYKKFGSSIGLIVP